MHVISYSSSIFCCSYNKTTNRANISTIKRYSCREAETERQSKCEMKGKATTKTHTITQSINSGY